MKKIIEFIKSKSKDWLNFKISMHPLFLILGLTLFFLGEITVFIVTTLSALLHEFAHYVVASRMGYSMQKIRLMPFGAELFGDFDSFQNRDELKVAIAGPIMNFCICIVVLGLWWIKPVVYSFTDVFFSTNLVMGIFNLLPIFPLDGGRILLCLLSKNMERKKSAKIVKNITKTFAICLFIVFILTLVYKINLTFGIMAFMLYFSASSNFKDATYQKIRLNTLVEKKCVEWVIMSVPEKMQCYELRKKHIKNRVIQFIVLDGNNRISHSFSELELEDVIANINPALPVKNLKNILLNNNNNSLFIIDKIKKMWYNPRCATRKG